MRFDGDLFGIEEALPVQYDELTVYQLIITNFIQLAAFKLIAQ